MITGADIVNLLSSTLISMVPILLASVGEIITEKSGVVNIGLEGIFIISSFAATVVAYYTGDPLIAFFVGTIVGSLSGLLHGIISAYLNGDQIIAGVGFNSFAYGLALMIMVALWQSYGSSPTVKTLPMILVPVAGTTLYIPPLVIAAFIIAVLVHYWLNKTRSGLKVRACGEDPRSAESMGINVRRTRLYATILGATLAGMGGAYLTVWWIGQFTKFISAGRGFIALANVAFSNWNPLLAILGALIFGFFSALSIFLPLKLQQIYHVQYTAQIYLFNTIPYIATLVIVAFIMKRVKMPRALGKPYIKE